MPQNDDVYTITDTDIASLTDELRGRRGERVDIRPDRRPSASMRGGGPGDARALTASTLSLFICGAGQMYNRQGKLGLLLFLMQTLVAAANWAVVQLWPSLVGLGDVFSISEWRLMLGVAIADALAILLPLASIYQAYRFADVEGGGFEGAGNPIFSGLASLLLPGWGQLVNAQAGKAITFLFSILAGVYVVVLARFTPFLALLESVDADQILTPRLTAVGASIVGLAVVSWILSVYDAILVANFRRRMV